MWNNFQPFSHTQIVAAIRSIYRATYFLRGGNNTHGVHTVILHKHADDDCEGQILTLKLKEETGNRSELDGRINTPQFVTHKSGAC